MNNKKAGMLDWFIVISVLFIAAVALIAGKVMIDKVDTSGIFADTQEAQDIVDITKSTLVSFDNMMLFVVVGLSLFVIISSAVVYHHPAYFFIGLFLLVVAITVAATFSNTFWVFTQSEVISSTMTDYPKLTFLMNNLPFYVCFMGMASILGMFVSFKKQ